MKKIKNVLKKAQVVFKNSVGYLKSISVLWLWNIRKPGIFFGYHHWEIAKKYADKRSRQWKHSWDQLGKTQYIFPYSPESLLVCSAGELKKFKKLGIISTNKHYAKLLKSAYYKSK